MSHLPALSKKFATKRNFALIFVVSAVICQAISIGGSLLDASKRKKQLQDFESGMGSPPKSSSTTTETVFAVLQLLGLLGFGIAFFELIQPLHKDLVR